MMWFDDDHNFFEYEVKEDEFEDDEDIDSGRGSFHLNPIQS